jgi:hypothetical protein
MRSSCSSVVDCRPADLSALEKRDQTGKSFFIESLAAGQHQEDHTLAVAEKERRNQARPVKVSAGCIWKNRSWRFWV